MPRTLDLASRLSAFPERRGRFAWPGHEYVRGWGVFGLPFDSGHYLALRVFPENDFAPYRTVWHRSPDGAWSIYADAPRLDIACPRYYGPACVRTARARIDLKWVGPYGLRVTMDAPKLDWTLEAYEPGRLRVMNAVSPRLPLWTWKPHGLLRAREIVAERLLGIGPIRLQGVMPSGHVGILMPARMYFVDSSSAILAGESLGRPTHLTTPVDLGGVPVASRGVLAIGQAAWRILDQTEYDRTRAETAGR